MPQIAQFAETYASQAFWLILIFGLLFLVVGRGMVPKVMGTMEMRDRQIGDDIAAAAAARNLADQEEAAWRQRENENRARAQALVTEAKATSGARTEQVLADAQLRIDARLEEAEARIAAARANAAEEIESVASDAAADIVRRLAGIVVTPAVTRPAVQEVMHG